MEIVETWHEDVVVLKPTKSYDNIDRPDRLPLRQVVRRQLESGIRAMVIDLEGITVMTDGDLAQVILGIAMAYRARIETAIVRPPHPSDARRFMGVALGDAFEDLSFDTLDDALEHLSD